VGGYQGQPPRLSVVHGFLRLALVASHYLSRQGWSATPCRFDVVAILGNRVEHLPDAFRL